MLEVTSKPKWDKCSDNWESCHKPRSNRWHKDLQSNALPTEVPWIYKFHLTVVPWIYKDFLWNVFQSWNNLILKRLNQFKVCGDKLCLQACIEDEKGNEALHMEFPLTIATLPFWKATMPAPVLDYGKIKFFITISIFLHFFVFLSPIFVDDKGRELRSSAKNVPVSLF